MVAAAFQNEVLLRNVAVRRPGSRDSMPVEIKNVPVNMCPRLERGDNAVAVGPTAYARVLVVVKKVVVDPYVTEVGDPRVVFGGLDINPRRAPARNFHIRDFHIEAPVYANADIDAGLLLEARPEQAEAGNPNVVAGLVIAFVAYDLQECL